MQGLIIYLPSGYIIELSRRFNMTRSKIANIVYGRQYVKEVVDYVEKWSKKERKNFPA